MTVDYILHTVSAETAAIAEWAALLLPESWLESQQKYDHDDTARQRYLLGRLLLYRRLLAVGYSYADLPEMHYAPNGKPFFNTPNLHFNLAYTEGIVLLAFSTETPVGIDAERIRPLSWRSFESYFTHEAWLKISSKSHPSKQLIQYWVMKEAATKLTGEGLSVPYRKIKFRRSRIILDRNSLYHTAIEPLPPLFVAYLVTTIPPSQVEINNLTTQIGTHLRVVRA